MAAQTLANYGGDDGILVDPARKKKTMVSAYLHRLQMRHFLLLDLLPAVGTVVAFASLWLLPIGWFEIATAILLWAVTGLGVSAGFHRLFTHRTFKAHPCVSAFLQIAGSMAGQGGVLSWCALHRRHHEFSDKPGDPHSPNLHGDGWLGKLRGLAHAHYTWMIRHEYPSVVHYAPDLLHDKQVIKLDKYYFRWVVLGLVLPALAGLAWHGTWQGLVTGFLWGGVARLFLSANIIWFINSILHVAGSQPFKTGEHSRNNGWLALPSFGESWHNNHHAFPGSAYFGLRWYRIDTGYWFIKLLEALGLVWGVNVPSEERIRAKRVEA